MTMGTLYWILMLLWFIFGLWVNWPGRAAAFGPYGPGVNTILLFVLLLLLGWAEFGSPVK